MIGLMPGEEVQQREGEGSQIFMVESITLDDLLDDDDDDDSSGAPPAESPDAAEAPAEEGPAATAEPETRDGGKTSWIIEMRSKIRFKGNKIELRNPEMVPALVRDINGIKAEHP